MVWAAGEVTECVTGVWPQLAFLIAGWLAGTVSPGFIDAIKRPKQLKELKQGLVVELNELKYKAAITAYHMAQHFGTLDRDYLKWLKPIVSEYRGTNPTKGVANLIDKLLELGDSELAVSFAALKGDASGGIGVRKLHLPLLDARLDALAWFDSNIQNHLLEIRAHLNLLNDDVDQANGYMRLTFDQGITGANRAAVESNLDKCYENYGTRARIVADRVLAAERDGFR